MPPLDGVFAAMILVIKADPHGMRRCASCGRRNRIEAGRPSPRCGACGTAFDPPDVREIARSLAEARFAAHARMSPVVVMRTSSMPEGGAPGEGEFVTIERAGGGVGDWADAVEASVGRFGCRELAFATEAQTGSEQVRRDESAAYMEAVMSGRRKPAMDGGRRTIMLRHETATGARTWFAYVVEGSEGAKAALGPWEEQPDVAVMYGRMARFMPAAAKA